VPAVTPEPLPEHVRAVLAAAASAALQPVVLSALPLPPPASPILVSVIRDEADRLPDMLRHYREGGIRRFCFIDNGSADGSVGFLAAQPDVDLLRHPGRFDARLKQGWVHAAMRGYGLPRWFLYADADELIVFDGAEQRGFEALAAEMTSRGIRRVRGLLVDMYADAPFQASRYAPGERLVEAYPFYDRGGYEESRHQDVMSVRGGPRKRLLGGIDIRFNPELTKYPLFELQPGEVMANPHQLWPWDGNFASPRHLGILHFKFLPGFAARVQAAIETGAYWDDSFEYRCYARALRGDPRLGAFGPESARYAGPAGLVENGVIAPIGWPKDAGRAEEVLVAARRHRAKLLAADWVATVPSAPPPPAPLPPAVPAPLTASEPAPPPPSEAEAWPLALPEPGADGLALRVNEFRVRVPHLWSLDVSAALTGPEATVTRLRFRLVLHGSAPHLEFRQGPRWPLFARHWPGTEEDAAGPVFRIEPAQPRRQLLERIADPEDRAGLATLLTRLPAIVASALPAQPGLTEEDAVLLIRAAHELPASLP
jgi:hypothetical protein